MHIDLIKVLNLLIITGLLTVCLFDIRKPCYWEYTPKERVIHFLWGTMGLPYISYVIAFNVLILVFKLFAAILTAILDSVKLIHYFLKGDYDNLLVFTEKKIGLKIPEVAYMHLYLLDKK